MAAICTGLIVGTVYTYTNNLTVNPTFLITCLGLFSTIMSIATIKNFVYIFKSLKLKDKTETTKCIIFTLITFISTVVGFSIMPLHN